VVVLVKHHHEHWDGTGYPAGFKGEQIPLGARIIHIADAYDAMTSARAYRKVPLTKKEAVEEIKKNSGSQFDPKIVEAFFRILDRI
jgi:HD-GYP domain-containing protein (c-di-GMP phosphodiesterase class II)